MGDSSKLRFMKNDTWPLCVSYATMVNAACSIFLNAGIIIFLSFVIKQTSVENFILKFKTVSKL